jgi:steroid 5-alpha reductase family enzyme
LLTGLCAVWGIRLATHLLRRWHQQGPDPRYVAIVGRTQKRKGWSFTKAAALMVFALQAPLLFIVALPVQLGQLDREPRLGPLALIGAALAIIGIAVETVGDLQLSRFKADPDNATAVMDRGLWRYTRHPNYFGDACTWWGLFLIAAETASGRWALPGPILLTWTLARWSGAPLVERKLRRTRPGYEEYIARTPSFVPWFPKRDVPA